MPHPLKPPDRRSTAAKRQARYRDRRREVKKFPRVRCRNCPKFFEKNQPTKVFCSTTCRSQFHQFGSAYGFLKHHIENKLVPGLVKEVVAIAPQWKELRDEIERMRREWAADIVELRKIVVDHGTKIERMLDQLASSEMRRPA